MCRPIIISSNQFFVSIASGTSPYPFCTTMKSKPLETICNSNRSSLSICNLHEYEEPIDPLYRVIADKPNAGGIVYLADYCPYLQVSSLYTYL